MTFFNASFDFSGVEQIQQDIKNLPDVFEESILETSINVEETFLPQLAEYPSNRAKHPFQFATPKSRRYYFYLVSSGQVPTDDYGYVRNEGYGRSWRVEVEQSGNEYSISVFSTFPAAKYVGGNQQVPGHTNTGWIRYQPILDSIGTYTDRQFFETVRKNV